MIFCLFASGFFWKSHLQGADYIEMLWRCASLLFGRCRTCYCRLIFFEKYFQCASKVFKKTLVLWITEVRLDVIRCYCQLLVRLKLWEASWSCWCIFPPFTTHCAIVLQCHHFQFCIDFQCVDVSVPPRLSRTCCASQWVCISVHLLKF